MIDRLPGTERATCPRCAREGVMSPAFPTAPACTPCASLSWGQLEATYAAHSYDGSKAPGGTQFVSGRPEVLLTAANSVNYFRGDYQHKAARWTGSAVEALAAATGLSALAMAGPPSRTPYRETPEYAFADRLRELVSPRTFVLDVIGMRDRQVDVSIGLGPMPDPRGEAVAARINRGFTLRGIRVGVGNPFPAVAPVTVTAFSQVHLGASAVQVGLAAWLRDPDQSPTMAKLTLDVLRDALGEVA